MFTLNFVKIVNTKRQIMDAFIKPLGLTRIEWQILTYIYLYQDEGRIISQKILNKLIDNDAAFTTRTLEKLEEKDLIKRQVNPKDKRKKQISLSAKGISLAKKLDAKCKELHDLLLTGLSDKEIKTLEELTEKVKSNSCNLNEK